MEFGNIVANKWAINKKTVCPEGMQFFLAQVEQGKIMSAGICVRLRLI
jgi:hypothetical protein